MNEPREQDLQRYAFLCGDPKGGDYRVTKVVATCFEEAQIMAFVINEEQGFPEHWKLGFLGYVV